MLFNGERLGTGAGPELDVAVDPVEGTRLLATGRPGALSVIAAAPRGSLWHPGASLYMRKLVVGEAARDAVDVARTPTENLHRIAEALRRPVASLAVFVLDKPRHAALVDEIRRAGARVALHTDGDVMGALLAALPDTEIDALMGVGGTPEGVVSAVAVRALRGGMQGVRAPQLDAERERLRAELPGGETGRVLGLDDLAASDDAVFAATAITDGPFLRGVRRSGASAATESLVIRAASGTLRWVRGVHRADSPSR